MANFLQNLSKMRCCVPFCKNTDDNASKSERITFHEFPTEPHFCTAWLRALGIQDSHLPDSAVVCSQHFLSDDIYETRNGLKQICTGAVPSTVLVCMICLDADSKQIVISKYKLETAYENLTGYSLGNEGNLKQTLCVECAQRLTKFSKFRDKSLRAHSIMMDLVTKHDFITVQHIKSINRVKNQLHSNIVKTTFEPNIFDLYIYESPEDKHTELKIDTVIEKNDERPMLIDEEYKETKLETIIIKNEINTDNVNDEFVESNKEYESGESIMETKPLNHPIIKDLLMKSTVKETVTKIHESIKVEVMFECKVCFQTFLDDNAYNEHMMTHCKQNDELDFGGDETQSEEPHLLTTCKIEPRSRSTSCDSSLITNKHCVQMLSQEFPPDDAASLIVPMLTSHKTDNRRQVLKQESVKNNKSSVKNVDFKITNRKSMIKTQKDLLINHMSNSSEKPFSCKLCEYKCARNADLSRHMRIHTGEKPFSCTLCEYKCAHSTSLINHMKIHTGTKPFSCKSCEYKSARKKDLIAHMSVHTGVKPYPCKLCESAFTQKGTLVSHMRTHTGEKPFSCKICEYKCVRSGDLVSHMRTHTGEKPFSCKFCGYRCSTSCTLVIHMRTHTGVKPFSCDLCKYQFARKNSLITHMRIHMGEKPFSCKLCKYKCRRSGDLVTHMRTHTGEKPHSCKLCEYKGTRSGDLVNHMKTHTGEKRFPCKLCNFKGVRKPDLVVHMRTHTGEKPYSCKLCEYKCARNPDLVIHMRTHTGEKPYSCNICEYKCSFRRNLVKHMRTHTETESFSE